MWEPFQRYRALDADARKIFRRAVVLLLCIGASLRLRGYKKTQDWLQTRLDGREPTLPEAGIPGELVQKTCRMVRAAEHYGIARATCLEESLALWYLLGRRGLPSRVRIGVRKQSEKFEAHAWVEYQGAALNQTEELHHHYAAFESELSSLPGEKP
jgi:hypothetical protein